MSLQRASLVEKSRQKPKERMDALERALKYNNYDADPMLWECGISTNTHFTQCIALTRVNNQYLTNVLLKINAKLGGVNSLLQVEDSRIIPLVSTIPTVIFGMVVSHGSPGRSNVPSVVARNFEPQWLSLTFSKAIFIGNGLVAIVPGLFAKLLTDNTLGFGPVSPFDAAACFLAVGMAIILSMWGENYGDPSKNKSLLSQFKVAAVAIASDEKIVLLGAIQLQFEGSMYTFVFLWTPTLSPNDEAIPHGFIFVTFMLASMLGSSIASRPMGRATLKVESYMQVVFAISSFTIFLPIITSFLITSSSIKGGSISLEGSILLFGFCTFEACIGIFWPSIIKMRSQYILEETRSTIMNFFCISLNIFVCIVLYNVII